MDWLCCIRCANSLCHFLGKSYCYPGMIVALLRCREEQGQRPKDTTMNTPTVTSKELQSKINSIKGAMETLMALVNEGTLKEADTVIPMESLAWQYSQVMAELQSR